MDKFNSTSINNNKTVSIWKALSVLIIFLFCNINSDAQTGAGSMTVDDSAVIVAPGNTESRYAEGAYFGPNADWVINGTLEIYSKNIWIAPGAKFTGTGKIIIFNPGDNPFYPGMEAGATNIDGNNSNFINLIIEHRNQNNVVLSDIKDPGYGTANPSGALAATLNIGGTLDLAVNRGNIILNGNNLAFNTEGKIINYSRDRMVVTNNSIVGHIVKEFAINTAFVFPVGVAEGDYTPATLTPQAPGKFYVSVETYSAANLGGISTDVGIDRMWNIYGSSPVQTNITLQHNIVTDGARFVDAYATIAKYLGNSNWDYLSAAIPSTGIHTRNNVMVATEMGANGAFFTKHSATTGNLVVPNLFTPNGDGTNDVFEIRGLDRFAQNDLVIVNRWGNEVYKSNNYQNNWSGEGLNEGTYYYLLRVKQNATSPWQVFKGYVTLIRAFKQ